MALHGAQALTLTPRNQFWPLYKVAHMDVKPHISIPQCSQPQQWQPDQILLPVINLSLLPKPRKSAKSSSTSSTCKNLIMSTKCRITTGIVSSHNAIEAFIGFWCVHPLGSDPPREPPAHYWHPSMSPHLETPLVLWARQQQELLCHCTKSLEWSAAPD